MQIPDMTIEATFGWDTKNPDHKNRRFTLKDHGQGVTFKDENTGQQLEFHCLPEFFEFCSLLNDVEKQLSEQLLAELKSQPGVIDLSKILQDVKDIFEKRKSNE